MKLRFVYGKWSSGDRPFNIDNLFTDKRGLTGSELSFFMYAINMSRRGHDVSVYVDKLEPSIQNLENVRVHHINSYNDFSHGNIPDWVLSWSESALLRNVPKPCKRFVNLQLNSFVNCASDFDDFVDVWTSPSKSHLSFMKSQIPRLNKWNVLPNGCDFKSYRSDPAPGRVIYASSPDRGLHWLLKVWPDVKREVPHANLRVFYNIFPWIQHFLLASPNSHHTYQELINRAKFINSCILGLSDQSVKFVGTVSRERMVHEMNEAEVLAYPCDPVLYTEGFSVTMLEACASETAIVTSDADALPSIYDGCCMITPRPFNMNMNNYRDNLIKSLTCKDHTKPLVEKAKNLASKHDWSILSVDLENILMKNMVTT